MFNYLINNIHHLRFEFELYKIKNEQKKKMKEKKKKKATFNLMRFHQRSCEVNHVLIHSFF